MGLDSQALLRALIKEGWGVRSTYLLLKMLVTFLPWSFPKWEAVPLWSSQSYREVRVGNGIRVSTLLQEL